jgi:quinol monooxygenase YgiN
MIGVVATLKIQADKAQEFEGAFRDFIATVKASEPGCLSYELTRSRTEPETYRTLELYRDEDSVTAHETAPYTRAAGARIMACLVPGGASIEHLDVVS